MWQLKTKTIHFDRCPKLMAIVNVTPDSFSDGGKYLDLDAAIAHALKLDAQGADILDIGGESTRPYSEPVSPDEEARRVVEVIRILKEQTQTPISIDTSKANVALAAVDAGAEIINDVTGLTGDPKMIEVALRTSAGVCAMHMQGTPQTMQDNPQYLDVVEDIYQYLRQRKDVLIDAGIEPARICLDPGIGFGKTHQHNLQLLAGCERFLELDSPILIGHSRKGFIGKLIGNKDANRDPGTLAITLALAQKRIQVSRVHEIAATQQALTVFESIGGIDGEIRTLD